MNDPVRAGSRSLHQGPRGEFALESWDTRDGRIERPVLHHPGAVALIVQPQPGTLLLVRQFRYALSRWTWEIPAGTRVPDEDPADTARRELAEEAGLLAGRVEELLRMWPAPGVSDEEMILYRVESLGPAKADPDPGELISARAATLDEIDGMIASGAIRDAKTLVARGMIPSLTKGR